MIHYSGVRNFELWNIIKPSYFTNIVFSGKESFYEELAMAQKLEMEKRERERKDNLKTELVVAAAKKAEEEAKRR